MHFSFQANQLKSIGMKWNFPTISNDTLSYPQIWDFTFWVKICSTIIILPHPWKYLQTSTLKSYYIYELWGNLAQTLLVPTLKGFKITRFIFNKKIFETILTMLALINFKILEWNGTLPDNQVILTPTKKESTFDFGFKSVALPLFCHILGNIYQY